MRLYNRYNENTLLMELASGSVQTAKEWQDELEALQDDVSYERSEQELQGEFDSLVEVTETEDGGYVEV